MGARPAAKGETLDFEKAMAELEETVRRLEAGELPLEDSLAAFEKGIALVRALHTRLDSAQMRIDELTQGSDGRTAMKPLAFAGDDDGDGDGDEEDVEQDR